MFLLDWYSQYLQIKHEWQGHKISLTRETKEVEVCNSCETLKEQLAIANMHNARLLDRIMERPKAETNEPPQMVTRPVLGRHTPWKVRQQMLQTEDREKAKLERDAPKPSTDVKDLERELDIASAERTAEATNKNA